MRSQRLTSVGALLCLVLLWPALLWAQANDRELIAVLDMRPVGASEVEASALTDRLREELLRTGRFTLVDRSQMESVLEEQALQQTGCTEQECAVQVGQILGVRKIVAGKVTKINDNLWQLSAIMVDVETTETIRAESIQHRGDFFGLLTAQVPPLAAKLAGNGVPPVAAQVPPPQPEPAAKTPVQRKPWMLWAGYGLIGVGVLAQLGALGTNNDATETANQARATNDPTLYEEAVTLRDDAERKQAGAFLLTAGGAGLLVYYYYFLKPDPDAVASGVPADPRQVPVQFAWTDGGARVGWAWRW